MDDNEPEIRMGIGIVKDQVMRVMKDLCIPASRFEALQEMLKEAAEHRTGNPADDMTRFIAKTKKANEIAFLSFITGIMVGSSSTLHGMTHEVKEAMKAALIAGAEHPEEVKQMLAREGRTADQTAPETTTSPAKKKDPSDDRMFV